MSPPPHTDHSSSGSAAAASTPGSRLLRSLPGSPVQRLQPRTVGQLLDGGFEVLRFRFRTIATVVAPIVLPLIVVPQALVALLGGVTVATSPFAEQGNPLAVAGGGVSAGWWGTIALSYLSTFGMMLAQMLAGVGVAHLVVGWFSGVDPSPAETLRFVLRRSPVALGAWVLALLLKAVSAMACGLGLIYSVPVLALLAPVVAAEGLGATASLSRAANLGRRRLGPLLGIALLWWVISGLVSQTAQLFGGALSSYFGLDVEDIALVLQGIGVVTTVFLLMVQVSVTALVFIDVRVRSEALDLEIDAAELLPAQSPSWGVS